MKKLLKKNISIILAMLLLVTTMQTTFVQAVQIDDNTNNNTDELKMNKTATPKTVNGVDGYEIELSSYVTGEVEVTTSSKPSDIVLVLDTSGSMNEGIDSFMVYAPIKAEVLTGGNLNVYDNTNIDGYYYALDEETGKYLPLTKTADYQYWAKPGHDDMMRPILIDYKVYVYEDENGKKYVPARTDGTSLADKFTAGKPSDVEAFQKITPVKFYVSGVNDSGEYKINVLKQSVTDFINTAAKDGVNHRISIVTFADGAEVKTDFLDVTKDKAKLLEIVNRLDAFGGTSVDFGMEKALDLVENNTLKDDPNRNHSLVLFTDGIPERNKISRNEIANDALAYAKNIKDEGYTIYSAGISSFLNNTLDPATLKSKYVAQMVNIYMQYVSSNYPNAASLDEPGANGNYKGGKYLYATDEESFKEMFEKIREEITVTQSTLDKTTELTDYISDYFQLSPDSVKVYTKEYTGAGWGEVVAVTNPDVTIGENSVSVKGFDYKNNCVVEGTAGGKQLVVRLFVTEKPGFIGGFNVNTNKAESGIYHEDKSVKAFNQPYVTSNLKFATKDMSESVYIGNTVSNVTDLIDVDPTTKGIQYYSTDNKIYTFDGINNAFVDVEYVIRNEMNEIVGTCKISAKGTELVWTKQLSITGFDEKSTLTITATVTSKDTLNNTTKKLEQAYASNMNIDVFTPTISVNNDYVFAGETYDLNKVIQETTWSCVYDKNAATPKGEAPVLTHTFTKDGELVENASTYVIKDSADYKINTLIKTKDITTKTIVSNQNKPENGDVTIQAIFGELNITKNIDAAYTANKAIHSNQSFVFKITVSDPETKELKETYYQSIDFDQNDIDNGITSKTITLKGLEKGLYEVSEETTWSWKYNLQSITTNYNGNTNLLYIGEALENHTYFGTETGTKVNGQDIKNPGTVTIINKLNINKNVIGDCGNAINKFFNSTL